jgi:hypothetical protein
VKARQARIGAARLLEPEDRLLDALTGASALALTSDLRTGFDGALFSPESQDCGR